MTRPRPLHIDEGVTALGSSPRPARAQPSRSRRVLKNGARARSTRSRSASRVWWIKRWVAGSSSSSAFVKTASHSASRSMRHLLPSPTSRKRCRPRTFLATQTIVSNQSTAATSPGRVDSSRNASASSFLRARSSRARSMCSQRGARFPANVTSRSSGPSTGYPSHSASDSLQAGHPFSSNKVASRSSQAASLATSASSASRCGADKSFGERGAGSFEARWPRTARLRRDRAPRRRTRAARDRRA